MAKIQQDNAGFRRVWAGTLKYRDAVRLGLASIDTDQRVEVWEQTPRTVTIQYRGRRARGVAIYTIPLPYIIYVFTRTRFGWDCRVWSRVKPVGKFNMRKTRLNHLNVHNVEYGYICWNEQGHQLFWGIEGSKELTADFVQEVAHTLWTSSFNNDIWPEEIPLELREIYNHGFEAYEEKHDADQYYEDWSRHSIDEILNWKWPKDEDALAFQGMSIHPDKEYR